MSRPRLLDLFCCAGGAGTGYHRAGFDVLGVDIKPQPRYPFEFHQGDALAYLVEHYEEFDAVHASPPCQSYTDLAKLNDTVDKHPRMIPLVREVLYATRLPYVIENVEGAEVDMLDPVTLCGTQFPGLRVLRHRLFETGWWFQAPSEHPKHPLVYTLDKRKRHYGRLDEWTAFVQVTGGGNCSKAAAADAMGIDWMTKQELNEALPPAYTEFIGAQLMEHLQGRGEQDIAA